MADGKRIMAAVNKHLEKAERLLQKGKPEGALQEFLIAWKEEPDNDAIVRTVAELYLQLNKMQECRQCYRFLFDKFVERSDASQAVAGVLKPVEIGESTPLWTDDFNNLVRVLK